MAFYLYRGSYTAAAWAAMVARPTDIAAALRPGIEAFGGRVAACFLTAAASEPIGFVEFPDPVAAAAWLVATRANSAVAAADLTPLITTQEGVEAMTRAGATGAAGACE